MASSRKKSKAKRSTTSAAAAHKQPQEAPVKQAEAVVETPDIQTGERAQLQRLHVWNKWLAAIHAFQGVVILLLSVSKTIPITTNYLTLSPAATEVTGNPVLVSATHTLFNINLAWLVAIFFFMSAAAHLFIATVYRKRYEADLSEGINRVRWFEYGLSASTMMVAIALLSGVNDFSSLLMIFVLDLIMNLTGLAMELYNRGKNKPNWLIYRIGCLAGIVPWIVFAVYIFGANVYGSGNVPTFVYWIYASIFIFFNCFALNMYLQYKKKGKWADYLYGERMYMILSLVAKTALAWQVFAGTLRP